MKKKKIILIIILSIITLLLVGLMIIKNNNKNDQQDIVQTNERDETKEQIEIINEFINIRKENDSQSDLLGKVYKGEIYTVLDKLEDEYYVWCKIETNNGIIGHIAVKYEEEYYVNFLEIVNTEETNEE